MPRHSFSGGLSGLVSTSGREGQVKVEQLLKKPFVSHPNVLNSTFYSRCALAV
jgi:hypothetical protein